MAEYAERTGLTSPAQPPRRYLWTDAFAVCNYLELHRQTNVKDHLETALRLVDQVHGILGRHSDKDLRTGWISGLTEHEGIKHPTRGGLRIGKKENERKVDEHFDERLEWDRDGQYFHYLTKWMQALACTACVTGQSRYLQWALELAQVACNAFIYTPLTGPPRRMYWKMSIDLSRPLVLSMGQHDPLDGWITCMQLQATTNRFQDIPKQYWLDAEVAEFRFLCEGKQWATDDALGIGGLLTDAFRLAHLVVATNLIESVRLASLLKDAEVGLDAFMRDDVLNHPATYRLAFRELGLAIGIHAINETQKIIDQHRNRFSNAQELLARLTSLNKFHRLAKIIERFWLEPGHQQSSTWTEHFDINSVMLATSLIPSGYLSRLEPQPSTPQK
ncbi:MAG: hypothetical protein QNI91_03430 [Arenicellales bacterium]|nr:hypothetical protein [Arenicellales bacterium]